MSFFLKERVLHLNIHQMQNNRIDVALIDDHQLFTEALAELLTASGSFNEVKTYTSIKKFLEIGADNMPDVIITEIIMAEMSAIDFLAELKKLNTQTKVIILSSLTEIKTIRFAIRNGTSGYLSKDTSADELIQAVITVHEGEPYIGESLRKKLIRNTLIEDKFIYNLSPREKEVLQHVCSGKTIKESAFDMQLSVNTVQTYYKTILKKFNMNRTADLIVFAIQNGLYNPKANSHL